MANKKWSIDRSVNQVVLILFQIGPICSVFKLLGSAAMQMYEDLYVAQKGYLSALHFWGNIRCRQLHVTFCCFLSEINILALTRSSEIHILIYFDLKSRFLTYALHEMKILLIFMWNSTALPSGLDVKSTF